MKKILSIAILFCLSLFTASKLHAQEVSEANIKFAKMERPGFLATYPYSKGIVENALRSRLEKAGLGKPKSQKSFASYQGVNWTEVASGQVDVYWKVDANSKDNNSTIIMLVSKGYDNYIGTTSDATVAAAIKNFLNSLSPDIKSGQLMADIGAQEEIVRKAEKEYKDVDEEGNKLAREKERIEKQMAENATEKAKRGESLSTERTKLETMKATMK